MTHAAPTWTDQQRKAIETRGVSIALAAGAGCGKTFVLTERFLAQLEPGAAKQSHSRKKDGAPPTGPILHDLIAITFTERAAREMRDRIREKCFQKVLTPSEHDDYWLELLRSLDTARISTIHAFCGALLRSHAVEAQLDPQFTVLDQAQADTLLTELIDDVLRERLAEQHAALLNLAVDFGLERVRAMTAALLEDSRTIDFAAWLEKTPQELASIWANYHQTMVLPAVLDQIANGPAAKRLLKTLVEIEPPPATLQDARALLLAELPALPKSKQPAQLLQDLREAAKVPKGGKKAWADEAEYEMFRDTAKAFREAVDKLDELLSFDAIAAQADAKAGLDLLDLAQAVHQQYEARKKELALLDFNDLLVRAWRLLTDPAHAELQQRISNQVRLLLVDEFQDTDPVQVELIKALCGQKQREGKLFFVGDHKQSIYRFRGADPSVFRNLQSETPSQGRLPLSENFRSQPAILDFANALFCDALTPTGDPTLAYQPLRPKRKQITKTPAVEFLWAEVSGQKKSVAGTRDEGRQLEAEFIARRIRSMLDQQERLVAGSSNADGSRPVEMGDFAILFRTLSDVQHYEDALRRWGIDYYLVGGHAFYSQQEIYDVLNLLRALASPADGVSLAGVLRSPMFALTDETLFWLAQHPQGLAAGLFADRLPSQLAGEQLRRAQFAAATLNELRNRKDRVPIAALLNEALARTGYDAALLGEFLGERKLANIRKLIDQARSFDQAGILGLADFIVELSEFVVRQPREALAATHPEDSKVVRLMTIHQAKGLEFPVVFVVDVNRASQNEGASAAWSDQLGPLVRSPARTDKSPTGLNLYKAVGKSEEADERIRLMYVAVTRAADYLVLAGSIFDGDFTSPSSPWTKLLAERFDLQSGRCLARLPKDYDVPAVKVTLTAPAAEVPINAPSSIDVEAALKLAERSVRDETQIAAADSRCEPIPSDENARRRFSVSRLTGALKSDEETSAIQPFVGEDENSSIAAGGSELGILVHGALANFDFQKGSIIETILRRQMKGATEDSEQLVASATKLISQFAKSSRAKQLAATKLCHRELEFLLSWPLPGEGDLSVPNGEKTAGLFLQGVIDCLYQDDQGQWHLLDYKTDQVSAEQVKSKAEQQFQLQLGIYALAVEQIMGQAPTEIVVHFLRPGAEHRFEWTAKLRSQVIEQVNQALAAEVDD